MYSHAMDPFEYYQRSANPPRADKNPRKTYTQFRRGDASFFILDTRTYRSIPPAKAKGGAGNRTMLGAQQLDELLNWISTEKGWKVVVSGVPVTRVGFFGRYLCQCPDRCIYRTGVKAEMRWIVGRAIWRSAKSSYVRFGALAAE